MSDTLLTVKETAVRFGVSTTTVYDWIKRGNLRCILIGRIAQRKYIPLESVEAFEAERLRGSESDSDNWVRLWSDEDPEALERAGCVQWRGEP